ncbi:MAG: hypothetical protein GX660_18845 [Clostridiaceae bacterium]|nr:hypothetical protein [Clostridiaceae bacterium]
MFSRYIYSIRQTGLEVAVYSRRRFRKGTFPENPKTEKFPFRAWPVRNNNKLKKHSSRKALYISGDFSVPLSPIFR